MGRRMRPLDPAEGVAQRFACELRALRAAAGEPPFWKMARRCEVSKSALAAAVAGYDLPSERVLLAYVRASGGDARWWSERLRQARDQLEAAHTVPETGELPQHPASSALVLAQGAPPVRAMARDPSAAHAALTLLASERPGDWRGEAPERPGGWRGVARRRWLPTLAVLEAAALVAAVSFAVSGRSGAAGPDPRLTASGAPRPVVDGTDPYMAGCGPDEQAVDREGLTWPGSGQVIYGWLTMFHSQRCNASWGSVSGPNSPQWTVFIIAHREPDGVSAPSSFSGDSARPGSWGNLLSTAAGCVWIEAYIKNSTGTSRAAKTDCYQATGPLLRTPTPTPTPATQSPAASSPSQPRSSG